MNNHIISSRVKNLDSDAIFWFELQPDFQTVWQNCPRGDWMINLIEKGTENSKEQKKFALVRTKILTVKFLLYEHDFDIDEIAKLIMGWVDEDDNINYNQILLKTNTPSAADFYNLFHSDDKIDFKPTLSIIETEIKNRLDEKKQSRILFPIFLISTLALIFTLIVSKSGFDPGFIFTIIFYSVITAAFFLQRIKLKNRTKKKYRTAKESFLALAAGIIRKYYLLEN